MIPPVEIVALVMLLASIVVIIGIPMIISTLKELKK